MHHTDKHTRGPTEANAMGDGDDDDDDDENKNTASQVLRLYLRFSLPDHFNPTAQVTADTLSEMIGASKGAQEAVCRCLTAVLLQMQARLSRKPKNLSPAELREKRMRG